ncbi:hypothetical protein G3495_08215 [Shewanella baltica]|uniref:hypothetical protein n=1 Tax=Shewanella baltica TaxID=62322 RepID=UPI00217DCA16|nr:hypothetical protein [Shewanella baltica]MCS6235113.1 hypothetical protein [Shewanella baltica]MCS6269731.1 hypothetical protein [Shewanella baltica]
MNNLNHKKTGSQPAKIDTARQTALTKAIVPNLSLITHKELPSALKHLGGGDCGQRLISLVYNIPLITTHEIHANLGISNAHDISKKLAIRLAKAGYTFEKLPLNGIRKPSHWLLRRLDHE